MEGGRLRDPPSPNLPNSPVGPLSIAGALWLDCGSSCCKPGLQDRNVKRQRGFSEVGPLGVGWPLGLFQLLNTKYDPETSWGMDP